MLRLILEENSFQFNGKALSVQTHGTAMSTKTAISFPNNFMAYIVMQSLSKTVFKPTRTVLKRYINDIVCQTSLCFLRTSKLRSPCYEIRGRNIWHWDNVFRHSCIPRHNTHRKSCPWCKDAFQTETFQYIHFHLLSPTKRQNGFVKGEALRIRRRNSSERLRKYFRFQKALDGQRLATQFWKKNCYQK